MCVFMCVFMRVCFLSWLFISVVFLKEVWFDVGVSPVSMWTRQSGLWTPPPGLLAAPHCRYDLRPPTFDPHLSTHTIVSLLTHKAHQRLRYLTICLHKVWHKFLFSTKCCVSVCHESSLDSADWRYRTITQQVRSNAVNRYKNRSKNKHVNTYNMLVCRKNG